MSDEREREFTWWQWKSEFIAAQPKGEQFPSWADLVTRPGGELRAWAQAHHKAGSSPIGCARALWRTPGKATITWRQWRTEFANATRKSHVWAKFVTSPNGFFRPWARREWLLGVTPQAAAKETDNWC